MHARCFDKVCFFFSLMWPMAVLCGCLSALKACMNVHPRLLLPCGYFLRSSRFRMTFLGSLRDTVTSQHERRWPGHSSHCICPSPTLLSVPGCTSHSEGVLTLIWKSSPARADQYLSCLRCLPSIRTARSFCRERSIALVCGSLQQVMRGRVLR